jgi:hypothetical protein
LSDPLVSDALSLGHDLVGTPDSASLGGLEGCRKDASDAPRDFGRFGDKRRCRCDAGASRRSRVETKGTDMLFWLLRQLDRIERRHAVADVLMSEFGVEAYAEARRREGQANSDRLAREWRRVALVIARRTRKRVGLDTATRPPLLEFGPVDEPTRMVSERPQIFRLQFVCGTPDRGPTNLTEKQIQAADPSGAIIAAANTKWPPRTIGLRILDREGREVFGRQKADRR